MFASLVVRISVRKVNQTTRGRLFKSNSFLIGASLKNTSGWLLPLTLGHVFHTNIIAYCQQNRYVQLAVYIDLFTLMAT